MGLQPAEERGAEAGLMRAALGGRDRVAIGPSKSVFTRGPGDRPFHRAVTRTLGAPDEHVVGHGSRLADLGREIVAQAAGKTKHRRLGHLAFAGDRRVAFPANLHAREEVGLGSGRGEDPLRAQARPGAEDLRIAVEAHHRAAAIMDLAEILQRSERLSAGVALAIEPARPAPPRPRAHPTAR